MIAKQRDKFERVSGGREQSADNPGGKKVLINLSYQPLDGHTEAVLAKALNFAITP